MQEMATRMEFIDPQMVEPHLAKVFLTLKHLGLVVLDLL